MVMQANEKKNYTSEEYLELEINSEQRHEYINGEIIPMTGGTPDRNQKWKMKILCLLGFYFKFQFGAIKTNIKF